jgi:hypothetical protein
MRGGSCGQISPCDYTGTFLALLVEMTKEKAPRTSGFGLQSATR